MSESSENRQPIWAAESNHPELCVTLREGLREIVDPELGYDIIQLGLIRDVIIEEEQVVINMILTTPFCPYGPAMLESTRGKAEEVLGKPTRIDYGAEHWDFSMMEEGLEPDWGMF